MINLKQELLSYPPIDIDSLIEKEPSIPDNMVNSIILYNKALDNIRQNSEDIAIIELKKAVSMNPNFHEAMNLLGICYVYTKDYAKATEMFEKVAAFEKNGVKALNYINIINNGNSQSLDLDNKKGSLTSQAAKQNTPKIKNILKRVSPPSGIENRQLSLNASLIRIVAGFAAGIAIMAIFMYMFKTPLKNIDVSSINSPEGSAKSNTNSELELKVSELTEKNKNLESQLQNLNSELNYYKSMSKLNEIESLSVAKKYEAAADMLVIMKTMQFKESEKVRYDNLYNNIIPKAAWAVFNDGNNLVKNRKFEEALAKLSKVQVYGNGWNYLDATYYKMGVCYKELNESKNALEMFQKLIEKYPSSQYASYASYKITELTGAP